MKKIINGKRYNTDTAKLLVSDDYSYPGDFNYTSESLYIKRTGEYFLQGEGGAMTKYSICSNNSCCGGSVIFPLSEDEARAWIESHANNKYEEIFGDCEE